MNVPTVIIKTANGDLMINQSEFIPGTHELSTTPAILPVAAVVPIVEPIQLAAPAAPLAPLRPTNPTPAPLSQEEIAAATGLPMPPAAPLEPLASPMPPAAPLKSVTPFVMPIKGKFYITDKYGTKISATAYASQAEAFEAAKSFIN